MDCILTLLTNIDLRYSVTVLSQVCVVVILPCKICSHCTWCYIRELKQQWQGRLQKRHLKSEVALLQTLVQLLPRVQFAKCWLFLLELNSKRLYRSSRKEKESRCLVFTSSRSKATPMLFVFIYDFYLFHSNALILIY